MRLDELVEVMYQIRDNLRGDAEVLVDCNGQTRKIKEIYFRTLGEVRITLEDK